MTIKIGFIIPTKREAVGLINALLDKKEDLIKGRKIYSGNLGALHCTILISGIGKVLAASGTQLLIDSTPDLKMIFHLGCAGAINPHLKLGSIIIGDEIIDHAYKSSVSESVPSVKIKSQLAHDFFHFLKQNQIQVEMGKMLSGDEDIVTTLRKEELFAKFDGLSVDWESFACLKICKLNNVECIVVRTICDSASEATAKEFQVNFDTVSKDLMNHVIAFLTQLK